MDNSGEFISFCSSRLHYYRWGRGSKLLLCFHGYGETAASFAFLGDALGEEFTVVAIDLPFHGKTEWNECHATATSAASGETLAFSMDQLISVLDMLVEDIAPGTPWYLMGYSMGGRIALSLLQAVPDKIARLILVAPDGLRLNPWYWLATQTGAGRRLFRYTMYHPGWFFLVLRACNALKLVNPSIYKFVAHYIDDPGVRRELYIRWTGLRKFRPRLSFIRGIILQRQLPVRILYGRHDRIIRVKRGEQFRKGIEPYCQLEVLPAGHQLLQSTWLETFLSMLKD